MDFLQRYLLVVAALCLLCEATIAVRVGTIKKKVSDQSTAASWWQRDALNAAELVDNIDYFSSTHGLVQTHPNFREFDQLNSAKLAPRAPGKGKGFKHLDYSRAATAVLFSNPSLSSPEECARACRENDPPRTCYYHFTLEYYTVLGAACQVCTPNATNNLWSTCQCVLADGVERGILSANRMIPGPSIQVCENDRVVIDVENHMEGMEVTIHWHGIWQRGSQYYDGVPFVTQCPIQQGNTFRYQWDARNAGTHFWHAHTGLQKLDGLYGSIVIRQAPSADPNSNLYDFDLTTHVMLISDWMHEDAAERFPGRLAVNVGQNPESLLINGKGQFRDPNTDFTTNTPLEVFTITPGRRYRFRMINSFATVCPAQLTIERHTLTVIATDGEPVKPVQVNTIISFSGERYDFVINADQPVGAYWIHLRGLGECGIGRVQQIAILRYARGPYQPASQTPTYDVGLPQGVVLNPLDGICNTNRTTAVCVNQLQFNGENDTSILNATSVIRFFLPFRFLLYNIPELFVPNTYNRYLVAPDGNHVYSLIDEIAFTSAPSPLTSQYNEIDPTQFCNGDNKPANCSGRICSCTHKLEVPLNSIVEFILIDEVQAPNLSHPFHLHGQAFYVLGMGRSPDRNVTSINLQHTMDLDRRGLLQRRVDSPPRKDTIAVPNNGYAILRFNASNPGFWYVHCHFMFHIAIGMDFILQTGQPSDLPPVPPGFPRCGNFLPPIQIAT